MSREPKRRPRHAKPGKARFLLKSLDLLPPSRFTNAEFAAAANRSFASAGVALHDQLDELAAAYDALADEQPDVSVPAPRSPEPSLPEPSSWVPVRRSRSVWPAVSGLAIVLIFGLIMVLFQPLRPEPAMMDRHEPVGSASAVAVLPRTPPTIAVDPRITWRGTVQLPANGAGLDFDPRPPKPGKGIFVTRTGERFTIRAAAPVVLARYGGKHIPDRSDCADFLNRLPVPEILDPQHDDDVCARTAGGRIVHLDIRDVDSPDFIQAEVTVWLP